MPLKGFIPDLGQPLKVYISRTAVFPNVFNAEVNGTTKNYRIFCKDNKPEFEENYLYISIYAET
jgi:hypothetical protein